MRDLSKTKLETQWKTKPGTPICQIRVGKRGGKYICFRVVSEAGFPGRPPKTSERWVDFRDMNRNQLSKCAREIGSYLTDGIISQDPAEKVLDLIYAELNKRFENL